MTELGTMIGLLICALAIVGVSWVTFKTHEYEKRDREKVAGGGDADGDGSPSWHSWARSALRVGTAGALVGGSTWTAFGVFGGDSRVAAAAFALLVAGCVIGVLGAIGFCIAVRPWEP